MLSAFRLIIALYSVLCHLCSVSACLRGTKLMRSAITHNRHNAITHFLPLRQGANEVFREMTKCHFVPHEGSTTQCDAGPNHAVGRGWIKQLTLLSLNYKVRPRFRPRFRPPLPFAMCRMVKWSNRLYENWLNVLLESFNLFTKFLRMRN